jgi:hypothetical protein
MGLKFEKCEGVAQDRAEAIRWYRLAAAQGHARAQAKLQQLGAWCALGRVFSLHHASLKPLDHHRRILLRFFLPSSSFPGNKFIPTFSATSGCCENKYRGAEEELGEIWRR